MCIGEHPNNITVIILDINNVVQDTFNISSQVNDQLMFRGVITLSTLISACFDTFIVNVTMSNNGGEFLPTPSFGFGMNCYNLSSSLFPLLIRYFKDSY